MDLVSPSPALGTSVCQVWPLGAGWSELSVPMPSPPKPNLPPVAVETPNKGTLWAQEQNSHWSLQGTRSEKPQGLSELQKPTKGYFCSWGCLVPKNSQLRVFSRHTHARERRRKAPPQSQKHPVGQLGAGNSLQINPSGCQRASGYPVAPAIAKDFTHWGLKGHQTTWELLQPNCSVVAVHYMEFLTAACS